MMWNETIILKVPVISISECGRYCVARAVMNLSNRHRLMKTIWRNGSMDRMVITYLYASWYPHSPDSGWHTEETIDS
jgi:hypothetical protein